MKIDKANGNVCFEESSHTYFDKTDLSKKYISVTTLIGKFENEFDEDYMSSCCALKAFLNPTVYKEEKRKMNPKKFNFELLNKYGITEEDFYREKQNLLDSWHATNVASCERGTKIHAEFENSFYEGGKNVSLQRFGIGGKFECRKNYTDLDIENGVYPEYLIHKETKDGELLLAGQIDLLIKSGNEIIIGDFKTNKEIKTKGYYDSFTKKSQKMLYPLNHLEDCNLSHYTLQLSTYAWMIQQLNPNFVIKDLFLYHIDHSGNQKIYHCEYLKDEVERMLLYYKKQIRQERQKARRTKIEY